MGRYDEAMARRGRGGGDGLDLPAAGLRLAGKIEVRHGYVADPNPALRGRRQRVALNARHDALEAEYARGRISDGAYAAGQMLTSVFEMARGRRSCGAAFEFGDRVDRALAHEAAIVSRLQRAAEACAVEGQVRGVVGPWGLLVLQAVLADGLTFDALVAALGAQGPWANGARRAAAGGGVGLCGRAGRTVGGLGDDLAAVAQAQARIAAQLARLVDADLRGPALARLGRNAAWRKRACVARLFRSALEAMAAHWARYGVLHGA